MLIPLALLACKSATPTPTEPPTDTDLPTPEACEDDDDEPNDTLEEAATISISHFATLASGDEDWWDFAIPPGQRATVTLEVPDSGANLDLDLLFPTGGDLDASSNQVGEDEVVSTHNVAPFEQTFLLRAFRVDGLEGTCEDYALRIDLTCDEADTDAPNQRTDALPLGIGDDLQGQAAGDDWDWYAFDVPGGEQDTVIIEFAESVDTLDWEVWLDDDPDQELDDGTLTANAPIVLDNADFETLTFYVGVRSTHGTCNLYDLRVED